MSRLPSTWLARATLGCAFSGSVLHGASVRRGSTARHISLRQFPSQPMIASAARVAPKATRQILSTSLKRATRSVLRPPFAPPIMLGLIGDARVAGAIRSLARQFLGAAEAKVRLGRIADRPTAHRLPQFRNGHGFGYRHHNLPHRLGRGGFNHKRVKSEGGIPGDLRTVRVPVGGAPRRLSVRRRSGHIPRTHIDTAR